VFAFYELVGLKGEAPMSTTNNPGREIPEALTVSQRESIHRLGIALRKLYKSYLKEPPPERFLPLIAKLNEIDRRSLSANDA
jgi:hypothetical protein